MKKVVFLILTVLLVTSCKKKEETPVVIVPTPTTPVNSYVKFKVLGTSRTLDAASGSTFTKCYIENNILYVKGQSLNAGGNYGFEMEIANASSTSTSYDILGSSINLFKLFSANDPIFSRIGTSYPGTFGSVTLTKVKDIGGGIVAVNGTFSGTALNSVDGTLVEITEGQFYDNRTE